MPCDYALPSLQLSFSPLGDVLHTNVHIRLHVSKVSKTQPALGVVQTGSGQSLVTRALVISLLNRIKVCWHSTGSLLTLLSSLS